MFCLTYETDETTLYCDGEVFRIVVRGSCESIQQSLHLFLDICQKHLSESGVSAWVIKFFRESLLVNFKRDKRLCIPLSLKAPIDVSVRLSDLSLECDETLKRQIEIFNLFVERVKPEAALDLSSLKDGKAIYVQRYYGYIENKATLDLNTGILTIDVKHEREVALPIETRLVGGERFIVHHGFIYPIDSKIVYDVKSDEFHYPHSEFGNTVVRFWKRVRQEGLRAASLRAQKKTLELLKKSGENNALELYRMTVSSGKKISQRLKTMHAHLNELYEELTKNGMVKVGNHVLALYPNGKYLFVLGKPTKVLTHHNCWPKAKKDLKTLISGLEKGIVKDVGIEIDENETIDLLKKLEENKVRYSKCFYCRQGYSSKCHAYECLHSKKKTEEFAKKLLSLLPRDYLKSLALSKL